MRTYWRALNRFSFAIAVIVASATSGNATECADALDSADSKVKDLVKCIQTLQSEIQAIMQENSTLNAKIRQTSESTNVQLDSLRANLEAQGTRLHGVPSGLVIASLKRCSDLEGSWRPYQKAEGRFILGVGQGPLKNIAGLEVPGGAEMITLKPEHLPAHSHVVKDQGHQHFVSGGYSTAGGTRGPGGGELTNGSFAGGAHYARKEKSGVAIAETGEGFPHSNMPPFIALYICEKE